LFAFVSIFLQVQWKCGNVSKKRRHFLDGNLHVLYWCLPSFLKKHSTPTYNYLKTINFYDERIKINEKPEANQLFGKRGSGGE
jgi:hypothetical protein